MISKIKQLSSLEKLRPWEWTDAPEFTSKSVMRGEYFSYQICIRCDMKADLNVTVDSPIKDYLQLYAVKNNVVDFPTYDWADADYITKDPSVMPDMLMPLESERWTLRCAMETVSLWVSVNVPVHAPCGTYPISFRFVSEEGDREADLSCTFELEVRDSVCPEQRLKFTQWFHTDCIADAHRVPVYSEEHWSLIDKYMAMARSLGINMILTPIVTPPLDTAVGTTRPCVQLVKVRCDGGEFSFDYTLLDRWVELALKNGMKYFEMAHLFSQWGIKYPANIMVEENGREYYKFGWHSDTASGEYALFLAQFLPSLIEHLKALGIKERCYFHVSDEPSAASINEYKYAHGVITKYIDGCPTMDALSDYEFYEMGLVNNPVTAISHIDKFLCHDVENQWAYYFCGEAHSVSNRFLAMPSYRNRIIGLQMYKFGIKGFLQWGYNFYYSQESVKKIDPYYTTSADKAFPSGDAFSVYPVENGVVPSLRALVFKEALNDISVCMKLEEYIGRDAVIEMIDLEAGMNVTFKEYPRRADYILDLIAKMQKMIEEFEKRA
ncbi:MAG: DUF4091 domain-containing protein [Clostridia bacterium]|nr:DUF4091 domain-containing protein [Clostridia bacterium]